MQSGAAPVTSAGELFFCGICGYTQSDSTHASHTTSGAIRCSRCSVTTHASCLNLASSSELPPPPEGSITAEGFICTCCTAKIEECKLSRNASVFNNKVDPHYPCLFCDLAVVNNCPKKKQLHMKRVQCGLWAHSICHLLGNEACSNLSDNIGDSVDESRGEMIEEAIQNTPYDHWDVDMIVRMNTGMYAIIVRKPFLCSGRVQVELRMREPSTSSKRSDDNRIFRADCRDLSLGKPRKGDNTVVHSGPQKGVVGVVKAVLDGGEEVMLCDRPSERFQIRQVAWKFTRPDIISSSSSSSDSSSSSNISPVDSSSTLVEGSSSTSVLMRRNSSSSSSSSSSATRCSAGSTPSGELSAITVICLLCLRGGRALVRCGEVGCQESFHVPCALADQRCTVQARLQEASISGPAAQHYSDEDSDEDVKDPADSDTNVQFWLYCPLHRKTFEPSAQQLAAPKVASAGALAQMDVGEDDMEIEDMELENLQRDSSAGVRSHILSMQQQEQQEQLEEGEEREEHQQTVAGSSAFSSIKEINSNVSGIKMPNTANCSTCGKVGDYETWEDVRGKHRFKTHTLTASETGAGKQKYCGLFKVNPRYLYDTDNSVEAVEQIQHEELGPSQMNQLGEDEALAEYTGRMVRPPSPLTTFAPGMDPGECTVIVEWSVQSAADNLDETDVRDLFDHCGHIFRVEMMAVDDARSGSAKLYFSEDNAAHRAVAKFSLYSGSSSSSIYSQPDKHFRLTASHLGAQIYVGGLAPGVTIVKLKQVFRVRDDKDIDLMENKNIAFVKYIKYSTAVEAVKEWNKRSIKGVSCPKGVLTVSLKAGRSRTYGASSASNSVISFSIDRSGDRGMIRDRDQSWGLEKEADKDRDKDNPWVRDHSWDRDRDHSWDGDRGEEETRLSTSINRASSGVSSLRGSSSFCMTVSSKDNKRKRQNHVPATSAAIASAMTQQVQQQFQQNKPPPKREVPSMRAIREENARKKHGRSSTPLSVPVSTSSSLPITSQQLHPLRSTARALQPPSLSSSMVSNTPFFSLSSSNTPHTRVSGSTSTVAAAATPSSSNSSNTVDTGDYFRVVPSRDPRKHKLL